MCDFTLGSSWTVTYINFTCANVGQTSITDKLCSHHGNQSMTFWFMCLIKPGTYSLSFRCDGILSSIPPKRNFNVCNKQNFASLCCHTIDSFKSRPLPKYPTAAPGRAIFVNIAQLEMNMVSYQANFLRRDWLPLHQAERFCLRREYVPGLTYTSPFGWCIVLPGYGMSRCDKFADIARPASTTIKILHAHPLCHD